MHDPGDQPQTWSGCWSHAIPVEAPLAPPEDETLHLQCLGPLWSLLWPLTKTLAKGINSFDTRALRTIINIRWYHHVPNKELCALTLQPATSAASDGKGTSSASQHPTWALFKFNTAVAGWRRSRVARSRYLVLIFNRLLTFLCIVSLILIFWSVVYVYWNN